MTTVAKTSKAGAGVVRIGGDLRAYYFTRRFQQGINQTAFALGGNLHADATIGGDFNAGVTYGSAIPLGMAHREPPRVGATLPRTSFSVLK